MPLYKSHLALFVGILVLGVALVANAIIALVAVDVLRDSFTQVARSREVSRTLDGLISEMKDAEAEERAYLLTGEASVLAPYPETTARVGALLNRLDSLTDWNAKEAALMPDIQRRVEARLDALQETIRLRREEGLDAAMAALEDGRGAREMAALRSVTGTMAREALVVRLGREREMASAGQRAVVALLLANGAFLLVLGGAALLLRRTVQIREQVAAELRVSNDALAQASAEREAAAARVQVASDRVQAASDRVQAMQAQLGQQEKLASLGRLTTGVAHELKNPLNFVNNFAGLSFELAADLTVALAAGDREEAEMLLANLRENTAKIVDHSRRADEIVRTMLVLADGVSGEWKPLDFHAVLDEAAVQAMGPEEEERGAVHFERHYDPVLCDDLVYGVAPALTRLFCNVIENAVHAVRERAGSSGNGDGSERPAYVPTVWLRTHCELDPTGHEVAVVTVEDNGPGIPGALLPRLFEPFYTTKAPGQGTGLGLSLAHNIAAGHGGTLTAGRSAAGGGAFTVTLPLGPPAEAGSGEVR